MPWARNVLCLRLLPKAIEVACPMNQHNSESEYRYQLASAEARALVRLAADHLSHDVYNPKNPVSYTRTTYFDTADRALAKSLSEPVTRRLRVRQYASAPTTVAEPLLDSSAFLECKDSSGLRRLKTRYRTRPETLRALLTGSLATVSEEDMKALRAQPRLYEFVRAIRREEYQPVFSTWYRRVSLSTTGVRITIDENVNFCGPQAIGDVGTRARPKHTFDLLAGRIVEIKLTGAAPSWLANAMVSLPSVATPSKFQRGLSAISLPSRRSIAGTRPLSVLAPSTSPSPHE